MTIPTSRRETLLAMVASGSLPLAAAGPASAAPGERSQFPSLAVGLWTEFHEVAVDAAVTLVHSAGFSSPGAGVASYVLDADQSSRPITASRRASRNGRWFQLAEPIVTPQMFGARGDVRTDDRAAIQAAFDFVEPIRGCVFFPAGNYVISDSLRLPSEVRLVGAGFGSVINNQFTRLDAPQLVNKDPSALIYASIANMVFRGGSHGLKLNVTREVAGLSLSDVRFELQTVANVSVDKLLLTSRFHNVVFDGAPIGLEVTAPTSNCNTFVGCDFTDHHRAHLLIEGGEANSFIGCRFEGGGSEQGVTIDARAVRSLSFDGCYFEATSRKLLKEVSSDNSVGFSNCHFTGAATPSGLEPYEFDSDGVVSFGQNTWRAVPAKVGRVRVTGDNGGGLSAVRAEIWGDGRAWGGFRLGELQTSAAAGAVAILRLRRRTGGAAGATPCVVIAKIRLSVAVAAAEVGVETYAAEVQVAFAPSNGFSTKLRPARPDGDRELSLRFGPGDKPDEHLVHALLPALPPEAVLRARVDFEQFIGHEEGGFDLTPLLL